MHTDCPLSVHYHGSNNNGTQHDKTCNSDPYEIFSTQKKKKCKNSDLPTPTPTLLFPWCDSPAGSFPVFDVVGAVPVVVLTTVPLVLSWELITV